MTKFDRFQQRVLALVIGLVHDPIDARRSHEWSGSTEGGNVRIGAMLQKQAHGGHIARLRCEYEGSLARKVHPGKRSAKEVHPTAERRNFFQTNIRINSLFEEEPDEI